MSKPVLENYEITELDNGIRIVSEYIPYFRSISLGLWVASGSRNEEKRINGITHLIEHLVFKGTKKRSNKEIAIEFDSIGADFNAFTDKENSCFYCDFLDTHLEKCTELLFDIVFNPVFSEDSLSTEKKIILEEIKMVEDTPSEDILNYFYETVLADHPLSFPILGTRKSLEEIRQEDIINYFNKNYVFKNIVISAAGNVRHKELVDAVKRNIYGFDARFCKEKELSFLKEPLPNKKVKIIKKRINASNLCYGTLGCRRTSPDRFPLGLLMNIIGGSMSSRLFQKIREDNGLAYSVYAGNIQYADTGLIDIYVASDPRNMVKIVDIIENEIKDIKENALSSSELERAKENIKGSIVLNIEEISSRMFRFGKSLLMENEILPISDILNKIEMIKTNEIQEIANKYFIPERIDIVIMGKASKRSFR
ncbi:MAG TPA: insulinase family protein [Actinobacteria bacterium]|nr:insulinase family protein [Actinomycetota bacterium]